MPKRKLGSSETNSIQATIGIVVKTCRAELGITQEELAWRSGLHRTYVADVERGARNISLRSIASLANALEVSLGQLFSSANGGLILAPAGGDLPKPAEVLLIEDDAADAELTLRAFKRASFVNPVKVVHDGEEALEYLYGPNSAKHKSRAPQVLLVLLDLILPKISGLDVLRRIRREESTRHLPVAVVTGSRQAEDFRECERLDAVNVIAKPVSFEDLCRVTTRLGLRWTLVISPPPRPVKNSA